MAFLGLVSCQSIPSKHNIDLAYRLLVGDKVQPDHFLLLVALVCGADGTFLAKRKPHSIAPLAPVGEVRVLLCWRP